MYNNVYNFKYTRQLSSNNYEAIVNTSITYARHLVVVDERRHAYNRFSLILRNETHLINIRPLSPRPSSWPACEDRMHLVNLYSHLDHVTNPKV